MPIGGFLDTFPAMLYVAAHVIFLLVGLWAVKRATDDHARFASALWLYVLSQPVFWRFSVASSR